MKGTVLVVDDDAAVLELTALFLNRNGFTVFPCTTAAAAFAAFQEATGIGLVIADLELPGCSGIDLARQLQSLAPTLRILFISGYPLQDPGGRNAGFVSQLAPGSVEFLSKPFSGPELLGSVERILARDPVAAVPIPPAQERLLQRPRGFYETLEGQARLLNLVHDAIIVRNLEGRIQYWNHGAEALYGWPREEALGKIVAELLQTIFPEPVEKIMATLHRSKSWEGELRQIARDGSTVVVSTRWAIWEQPDYEPGILQLNRDITAQKRVEEGFRGVNREMQFRLEELHRAEKMSRSLLEAAPDAMVITDGSGSIVLVNAQTEKQFGYSRDELLGQNVELLLPQRLRERHSGLRAGYMQTPYFRPMGHHCPLLGLRKNGEEFPVEISLSFIETGTGMLITSAIRDISERLRFEHAHKAAS